MAVRTQMGDLSDLDTEDKSSLVAAINEAARSGGGGGSASNAVLYTPQTLTETQQTQARENIGAVAGDEALPLRVALTFPDTPDGSYTADKTFAEITAAYNTGRIVELYDGANVMSMISLTPDSAGFGMTCLPSPEGTTYLNVYITSQDEVFVGSLPIVNFDVLYDTIEGALPLGMTDAKADQIAKITAVDNAGRPTQWTPVDMPGGLVAGIILNESNTNEYSILATVKTDSKNYGYSLRDILVSTWANFRVKGLNPGLPWRAAIITDPITVNGSTVSQNAPYLMQLISDGNTTRFTYRITDSKGSTYLYMVEVNPNSFTIKSETYTQESEVACVPVSVIPDTYQTPLVRHNMNFYLWRDTGPV